LGTLLSGMSFLVCPLTVAATRSWGGIGKIPANRYFLAL